MNTYIRRAKKEDQELILSILHKAFCPLRPEGFDFRSSQPKIYDNPRFDFSKIHQLLYVDDKPVGVIGNLLREIKVKEDSFLFSYVGSVAIIPAYQGKGLLSKLMEAIYKENLEKHVVFSCLTGKRHRYHHYGYEKISYSYLFSFSKDSILHLPRKSDLTIREMTPEDSSECLRIYKKRTLYPLRVSHNFYLSLKSKKARPYVILDQDKIKGYYTVKDSRIFEFKMTDYQKALEVLGQFEDSFELEVPSYERELIDALKYRCETITIKSDLQTKIYNRLVYEMMLSELGIDSKKKIIDMMEFDIPTCDRF